MAHLRAQRRTADLNLTPGYRCWRPRTAAAGGRPQAGLEFVEKLLTTNLTGTDTRSGTLGMPLRVPLVASLVSSMTGLAGVQIR